MLIVSEDSAAVRNEPIVGHQVGDNSEPPIEEQNEDEEIEGKVIQYFKSYIQIRITINY